MAKTKNSDIRYQVLDRCLRRGGYSTTQLAEAVNVELELRGYPKITALNTIRKDLDYIASNYPVIIEETHSGRNVTYHYSERDMSIYNVGLNDDDLIQFTQALSILSRFEGMPQMEWLSNTINRLRLSVDFECEGKPIVGFDDCRRLQGRQYFSQFLSAISNKTVLKIEYLKFDAEEAKYITLSPCYLKEHSRRWFLLGMTPKGDNPIVLAFDRIQSFIPLPDETYREAKGIDFNNGYFKDIVGVTRFIGQEPEEVLLEVDNERLQYITTKPIHDSQEVIETGKYRSLVRLFVIPNVELAQFILSYGSAVTVISPEYYRDYIVEQITFMIENYEDFYQDSESVHDE